MDLRKRFGERIRRLRCQAGLSQQELGKAARLSAVAISNIERGTYSPAFGRLPLLARALGVEADELFEFGETP